VVALLVASLSGCLQQIAELRDRYEQDTADGLDLDIISTPDTPGAADATDSADFPDVPQELAPTDGSSDAADVVPRDVPPAIPDTATVYALLASECSPCHTDRAEGGLSLTDDGTLASRLLASSFQLPAMQRVQPGEPDNSYLFLKVTGRHLDAGGLGEPMPLGTPLSAEQTELLRRWVESGSTDEPSTAP
jgi:hypothetical protein